MLNPIRLSIIFALIAAVCCDTENQYFAWGKFGDLFSKGGSTKLSDLQKKLSEIEKKLDLVSEKQEKTINATCPIRYDGKCFRAIMLDSAQTDRNEAMVMCQNMGWKLANVYSREHFILLEKYIRKASTGNRNIWLKMTWNYSTRKIVMPDGSLPPTDVPWYSGNPTISSSYTYVYLLITQNADYRYNGILNRAASTNLHGALCETDFKL